MKKKKNGPEERIPTGIPGLDRMLEGGYVMNSSILIRGDTGTAKTLFCLQYLYHGAKDCGEAGAYISFSEPRDAAYNHGRKFGWDLEALAKKNKFVIIGYEPHEVVKIMEDGGGVVRDTIESVGAKRLVIDSLTAYEMFFENKYKANQSILGLFELLKKWNVTTLVTSEFPVSPSRESYDRLGFLTEGIINLYHLRRDGDRIRALEIVKMRDTRHKEGINRFTIGKNCLRVTGELDRIGKR
jgi:circadian clock protein KaiC